MRRKDWVRRMWGEIEASAQTPFAYGTHDCCLLVARVRDAMCDTDHVTQLQAAYHDEITALQYLHSLGGMEAAITSFVGAPCEAILARRGDICLVDTQRGLGVGVSVGTTIAVAGDGVEFYPISAAQKCWRVD